MNLQGLLNLQAIFYVVAIITMILHSTLLLILVILLFSIKKKITNITNAFDRNFDVMKTILTHPRETASIVGGAVADAAIDQAAKLFNKKPRDEEK